jgi:ATP-dependent 26S proteasome regulatory subunit
MWDEIDALKPTITLIIGSIISHIYKDEKTLTHKDFMLMISPMIPTLVPIIMSMFKTICIYIMSFFVKNDLKYMISIVNYINTFNFFSRGEKEKKTIVDKKNIIENNCVIANVEHTNEFVQMLITYILQNNVTCKYKNDYKNSFNFTNVNALTETQTWNDINISYTKQMSDSFDIDIDIYIKELNFSFIEKNKKYILQDVIVSEHNDIKTFTRYADFINDEDLKEFVINQTNEFIEEYSDFDEYDPSKYMLENEILKIIKINCPSIDNKLFMMDLCVVNLILLQFIGISGNLCDLYKRIMTTNFLFNTRIIVNTEALDISKDVKYSRMVKFFTTNSEVVESLIESFKDTKPNSPSLTVINDFFGKKNITRKDNTNVISFKLSSTNNKSIIDKQTYNNVFKHFINDVKNSSNDTKDTKNNKIKIFNTCIAQIENIEEVSNPEYILHCEENERLNKMDKDDPSKPVVLAAFMTRIKPSEKIKIKTKKNIVETTNINSKYRSLDTLYLRQNDMEHLSSALDNFKNNKALYERYCLPNKLGILLHGEPGTGKSSSIEAIASYLQKDIYYASLTNVKSNKDLQMIFDHVNTETTEGGIIVFEDIDAGSKAIHKRVKKNDDDDDDGSVKNTVDTENSFTLEYFLNLLQGSLTRDGSIFIATTNHIEHLDEAFYRAGRFDVNIDMKKCDKYQIKHIFQEFIGHQINPNVLKSINEDTFTPAEFIFHLINHINSSLSDKDIMQKFIHKTHHNKN